MRKTQITRKTNETDIVLALTVDGRGEYQNQTGCGFLDHMLDLFARHGRFDLTIRCQGDLEVDGHHTTEDVGIALGQAFRDALGDKRGIVRYGSCLLPMDESLAQVALDFSGRSCLVYRVDLKDQKVGEFDTALAEEFFAAFCRAAGVTLHIRLLDGKNSHHSLEAVFKGFARAVKQAVSFEPGFEQEIPSTKGVLD